MAVVAREGEGVSGEGERGGRRNGVGGDARVQGENLVKEPGWEK